MNPDTAELTVAAPAAEPAGARARRASLPLADALRRLRADPERMTAIRDSWRALWSSRLLVWVAGVATIVALGWGPPRKAFDPPGVTKGFGWLGDLLAAPAARWDSAWYLVIARFGYRPDLGVYTRSREAFFPLYPLGIRGGTALGLPPIAAGVLISTAALALALYGIHRLTTLELRSLAPAGVRPGEVARLAVLLMAFAPMAFYLSAVYSESLYLALSVGLFLCARSGKWAWVGVFGALATATRSTGLVLLVPALWLYLYGPREDLVPLARAGLGPRFALRRDVLWLALIPAGAVAYGVYLGLSGGDFLTPVHSQDAWGRHFAGPYVGVWDGLRAALDGARQLLSGQQHHVYFAAPGSAFVSAEHNILLFVFLAAGLAAFIGVARRLPAAYALYVLAALAVPLSYPVGSQPLMSMPRFLMVLFPMAIWLAMWLSERPRAVRPVLVLSACSMVFFLADFATWHWVA